MDCFLNSLAYFYMNMDKWTRCGHILRINGLDAVIMLYLAPDRSCDCILYRLGFG